jgi:hypothetical protein
VSGPFETEQQARETEAVQAIYEAFDADPGAGKMAPHTLQMLTGACMAARVDLGAFDRRVLAGLSGWEPETAAVVCGLISRAHRPGAVTLTPAQLRIVLDALADAADYRRICISQFCNDCADSAPELCANHIEADDESAIQAYEALSAELDGDAE